MDIEDFVKKAMLQIVSALEDAPKNKKFDTNTVEFDLAVTTTTSSVEGESKSGEAKIKIVGGGISKNKENKEINETVSRIKFKAERDYGSGITHLRR